MIFSNHSTVGGYDKFPRPNFLQTTANFKGEGQGIIPF
jgi:hypothetical protein